MYRKSQALLIDPTALGSRDPFISSDGRLELPMIDGWMVLSTGAPGPSPVQAFMIIPQPETSLGYALGYGFEEGLPGLFIQVETQPYDYLYGTADYAPTDEDRSFVLGQALANAGGEPVIGTQEITISDFPALRLEMTSVFGGDNNGVIFLIDAEQIMYTLTLVAPEESWEIDYEPLIDAFIANINIAPLQTKQSSMPTAAKRLLGHRLGNWPPISQPRFLMVHQFR